MDVDLHSRKLATLAKETIAPRTPVLNVSFNALSELESDVFKKLNALTNLKANHNVIHGLSGLSNCTKLTQLYLQHNQITSLKGCLRACRALEVLYLDQNLLTCLDGIQECTALKVLSVANNRIASISAAEFIPLTQIEEINLEHNRLSGSVDLSILAKCSHLFDLNLSFNVDVTDLKGSLPAGLSELHLRGCASLANVQLLLTNLSLLDRRGCPLLDKNPSACADSNVEEVLRGEDTGMDAPSVEDPEVLDMNVVKREFDLQLDYLLKKVRREPLPAERPDLRGALSSRSSSFTSRSSLSARSTLSASGPNENKDVAATASTKSREERKKLKQKAQIDRLEAAEQDEIDEQIEKSKQTMQKAEKVLVDQKSAAKPTARTPSSAQSSASSASSSTSARKPSLPSSSAVPVANPSLTRKGSTGSIATPKSSTSSRPGTSGSSSMHSSRSVHNPSPSSASSLAPKPKGQETVASTSRPSSSSNSRPSSALFRRLQEAQEYASTDVQQSSPASVVSARSSSSSNLRTKQPSIRDDKSSVLSLEDEPYVDPRSRMGLREFVENPDAFPAHDDGDDDEDRFRTWDAMAAEVRSQSASESNFTAVPLIQSWSRGHSALDGRDDDEEDSDEEILAGTISREESAQLSARPGSARSSASSKNASSGASHVVAGRELYQGTGSSGGLTNSFRRPPSAKR